jgi:hypothetical protein
MLPTLYLIEFRVKNSVSLGNSKHLRIFAENCGMDIWKAIQIPKILNLWNAIFAAAFCIPTIRKAI